MMKPAFYLFCALLFTGVVSCKKDKDEDEDPGITQVNTLEVTHVNADGIYGRKYTFKVQFSAVGSIVEYGVVYKPWVGDKSNKDPLIGDSESFKIPFDGTPAAGDVKMKERTMRFADFNDANYRAYAVTADGEIVYGEVLYIVFT